MQHEDFLQQSFGLGTAMRSQDERLECLAGQLRVSATEEASIRATIERLRADMLERKERVAQLQQASAPSSSHWPPSMPFPFCVLRFFLLERGRHSNKHALVLWLLSQSGAQGLGRDHAGGPDAS